MLKFYLILSTWHFFKHNEILYNDVKEWMIVRLLDHETRYVRSF